MANTIDTSQAVDPTVLQPFPTTSLNFLQEAERKNLTNICLNFLGPLHGTAQPIVLWGLTKSGNFINEGAFFDNGNYTANPEIFHVNGASTVGFINPPVLSAVSTFDTTIDPIVFYDGSVRSVHQVKTFAVVDSPNTGSTILYSDMQFLNFSSATVSTGGGWTGSCTVRYNNKTGTVHLGGVLDILNPSGTIGTIPVGMRPSANKKFGTNFKDDSQWEKSGMINISTAGVISFDVNWGGSSVRACSFDGLSYLIY